MIQPPYQPLRIPPGWFIDWNKLVELDPTEENVRNGFFGGSSLFLATHTHHRFSIEVEWRPEDDPTGCYCLRVLYAAWSRQDDGKRCKGQELDFDWEDPIHKFTTRERLELVRELEAWLLKCSDWVREPN